MDRQDILKEFEKVGFDYTGVLKVEDLELRSEVRDMCADNRCHMYEKCWICPPACGTIDELSKVVREYNWGILCQTVGELEDSFDYEGMMDAEKTHKKRLSALTDSFLDSKLPFLPMGAGPCDLCSDCTYPDEPCRFPERAFPSMEAYGLIVTDACNSAGVKYYYGGNTVAFSGLVLFK